MERYPLVSMSKQENSANLTPEVAVLILTKILAELQTPQNTQKLEEARDNVGNEMLKMMQYVFPIVMQIEMDIIKEFGYPESRDGIIQFAQMLRSIEKEDPEISRLHSLIKTYYLPPVSVSTNSDD